MGKQKEKEYHEVLDDYASWAERVGKHSSHPDDAWLDLGGVWWPNPHYSGEEVIHPELR